LDASNDGISKAYYIRIIHHIPQQDTHLPYDQLKKILMNDFKPQL
jgi:hypothetical protein